MPRKMFVSEEVYPGRCLSEKMFIREDVHLEDIYLARHSSSYALDKRPRSSGRPVLGSFVPSPSTGHGRRASSITYDRPIDARA